MNQDLMLKEIQQKGFKEVYYRFEMIVPRKFLGKGRSFQCIGGTHVDGGEPQKSSWYRDDCKIPMPYVAGVALTSMSKTEASLSFLIENTEIGSFVSDISKELEAFNFEVKIEEYKNVDNITLS